jgi:hypothetical protein
MKLSKTEIKMILIWFSFYDRHFNGTIDDEALQLRLIKNLEIMQIMEKFENVPTE